MDFSPSSPLYGGASQEWDKVVSTFVLRAAIGPAAPPVPPKKIAAVEAARGGGRGGGSGINSSSQG